MSRYACTMGDTSRELLNATIKKAVIISAPASRSDIPSLLTSGEIHGYCGYNWRHRSPGFLRISEIFPLLYSKAIGSDIEHHDNIPDAYNRYTHPSTAYQVLG